MGFIDGIIKGVTKRRKMPYENLAHCFVGGTGGEGVSGDLGEGSKERGVEMQGHLGEGSKKQEVEMQKVSEDVLRNGDEAMLETAEKDFSEQENEMVKQEKKLPNEEALGAAMTMRTTGSIGNFGKHPEISREDGSVGERLGRMASAQREHHYFQ